MVNVIDTVLENGFGHISKYKQKKFRLDSNILVFLEARRGICMTVALGKRLRSVAANQECKNRHKKILIFFISFRNIAINLSAENVLPSKRLIKTHMNDLT